MILVNLLLIPGAVSASVVIHQVLYDPIGTESGGEAIELKNIGTSAVDISEWVIRTQTSANDAVIPDNTLLLPGQPYIVADIGWDSKKDNPSWRPADTEQAITLRNTDSGVALFNSTTLVDAIGWGNPTDASLFEGSAATAITEAGQSLLRTQDTGDNSLDVIVGVADFGGASPDTHTISVHVVVENNTLAILDTTIFDDDSAVQGIQILPSLQGDTNIPISVIVAAVRDVEITAEINGKIFDLSNGGNNTFTGNLILDQGILAGQYQIQVTAKNDATSTTITEVIEVMSVIGFSLSTNDVNLTNPSSVVISNIGNVALDIGIWGTDLASGSSTILAGAIKIFYDQVDQPGAVHALTSILEILDTDILPYHNLTFGLQIDTTSAGPGSYLGEISFVGVGN